MDIKQIAQFLFKAGMNFEKEVTVKEAADLAKNAHLFESIFANKGTIGKIAEKAEVSESLYKGMENLAEAHPDMRLKFGIKNGTDGTIASNYSITEQGRVLVNNNIQLKPKEGAGGFELRSKGESFGAKGKAYYDGEKLIAETTTRNSKISMKGKTGDYTINVGKEGEVASIHVKTNEKITGTAATYESDAGLTQVKLARKGISIDAIIDNEKASTDLRQDVKYLIDLFKNGGKKPDGSPSPMELVLTILRPLRDRFNAAIDLFKFNGHKNFERFLNKEELLSEVKAVKAEAEQIKKRVFESETTVSPQEMASFRQLNSDYRHGQELLIECY